MDSQRNQERGVVMQTIRMGKIFSLMTTKRTHLGEKYRDKVKAKALLIAEKTKQTTRVIDSDGIERYRVIVRFEIIESEVS
jgi:hypothetical protein